MATITSAGSGNWNAGASWTGGSVPGAGDEAHIDSGHTITLTANASVGNVVIDGGTIAGGGYKITCVKTSGRLFDHSGTITGNLDVELQGTHSTTEDFMGTGNIRNLILNGSGLNVDIGRDTTIAGDLTITQGTLNTNSTHNHDLTVTGGDISVSGTLTLNDSTVQVTDTSSALSIGNTGTVTCGDTNLTVNAVSLGQGNFTAPSASGSFIITGEKSNLAFDYDGNQFTHNGGTIDIRTQATTLVDFGSNNGTAHIGNVKINHASCVAKLQNAGSLLGNLDIALGTLDTDGNALTVAGDVDVTGTLTGNASAISVGSLYLLDNGTYTATSGTTTITGLRSSGNRSFRKHSGATFTHSNGKVLFNRNGDQFIGSEDSDHTITFYDLELTSSGSAAKQIRDMDLSVANDLTVGANVTFSNEANVDLMTVTGDCDVTGTLNLSTGGNHSFGSLTIASGGTYSATSGTTTITGGNSATSYTFKADGTFTHNNGKMLFDFTPSQNWYTEANTYYDLEVKYNNNSYSFRMTDDSGNAIKILNNLTITAGMFEMHGTSDTLDVYGNTYINGGIFESESDQDTNKITHHGLVTINSGTYKINDGTTVKMNGGIRNVGGTLTVS